MCSFAPFQLQFSIPWDIEERAVEDIAYNDYKTNNVFQEIILYHEFKTTYRIENVILDIHHEKNSFHCFTYYTITFKIYKIQIYFS